MQLKPLVLAAAATLVAAAAQWAAIPAAYAQRLPSNVSCEPFRFHGNVYHERCTRTFYDEAGNITGTTVYYVDQHGNVYLIADE